MHGSGLPILVVGCLFGYSIRERSVLVLPEGELHSEHGGGMASFRNARQSAAHRAAQGIMSRRQNLRRRR